MQVKKFEAKTMKEALQMVKQDLGPDAIILSVRDNKRSFGLVGSGSIEITAAISEKSIVKKQYAESRLTKSDREQFKNFSARHQKDFIETSVDRRMKHLQARKELEDQATLAVAKKSVTIPRPLTSQRYIDISDDEKTSTAAATVSSASPPKRRGLLQGRRVNDVLEDMHHQEPAPKFSLKLDSALAEQQPTFSSSVSELVRQSSLALKNLQETDSPSSSEVISLKQEVEALRSLIQKYTAGHIAQASRGTVLTPMGEIQEKLIGAGIDQKLVLEIMKAAEESLDARAKTKRPLIDGWVANYLMAHTSVADAPARLHLFVGPSGHGKTLSTVKCAAQKVLNENKSIVIASCDHVKIGGMDQLKTFAQILGVPFEVIRHQNEYPLLMQKYADHIEVLVDCPGLTLKDMDEIERLRSWMPPRELAPATHLVLSCTHRDVDAMEAARRYQVTRFQDLLITKVDESRNHGIIYNLQSKLEKPLFAFGVGTRIPEDLEPASRERLLDLIYKITKLKEKDPCQTQLTI